jgi:hypothetical protein
MAVSYAAGIEAAGGIPVTVIRVSEVGQDDDGVFGVRVSFGDADEFTAAIKTSCPPRH